MFSSSWSIRTLSTVALLIPATLVARAPGRPALSSVTPASTNYSFTCGPRQAMIGVTGGAGQWVDWVRGVCMHVTNDGRWIGSESPSQQQSAGSSGAPFRLMCPTDHLVAAISGNRGQWLNLIQVHCRRMTNGGAVSGSLTLADPPSAGTAATSAGGFGPIECGSNRPVLGRSGSSGSTPLASVVDSAKVVCGTPESFQIRFLGLMSPSVIAGSPTRGTVTFTYPTPVALSLTASSDNPQVASVSTPTFSVGKGATSGSFSISTAGSSGGCAVVKVPNAYGLADYVVQPLLVHPSSSADAPVTLVTRDDGVFYGAPGTVSITVRMGTARPAAVTLASSNPQVMSVPTSVTIPPGTPGVAQFMMTTHRAGCVTLSATARGLTTRRTVPIGTIQ